MGVCHCDDQNPTGLDVVNNAEGITSKQVPSGPLLESGPCVRELHDRGFGGVHFLAETCGRSSATFGVPPRRRLRFLERLV